MCVSYVFAESKETVSIVANLPHNGFKMLLSFGSCSREFRDMLSVIIQIEQLNTLCVNGTILQLSQLPDMY